MFLGFYKSEYDVDGVVGRSVVYVKDGRFLGGNSGFSHIGSYQEIGGDIHSEITSQRHNDDPHHPSLLGAKVSILNVIGKPVGDTWHFTGSSPQLPNARFVRSCRRWRRTRCLWPVMSAGMASPTGCIRSISRCSTASLTAFRA